MGRHLADGALEAGAPGAGGVEAKVEPGAIEQGLVKVAKVKCRSNRECDFEGFYPTAPV